MKKKLCEGTTIANWEWLFFKQQGCCYICKEGSIGILVFEEGVLICTNCIKRKEASND